MKVRVITYRPIQRHWYRLLDAVQPRWDRLRVSRFGHVMRLLGHVLFVAGRLLLRVVARLAIIVAWAVVVVGAGTLFLMLSFAFGGGRLGKSISKAQR